MTRLSTIGTLGVLLLSCLIRAAEAQVSVEQQLRAERLEAVTKMPAPSATRPIPARDHFIEIERISRLPEPQRSGRVPAAYHTYASQYLGMYAMSASSILPPASLFERDQRVPGRINTAQRMATYSGQLEGMVGVMSPEEVADAILTAHNSSVLSMASHARLKSLFDDHRPDVRPLITADLDSKDVADIRRAVGVVDSLDLTDFDDVILEKYLASAPGWEVLRVYLMTSRHATVQERVMKDAQEHPESLTRHAAIIGQALQDRPAPEFLIQMLSSTSTETRLGAAQSLETSGDPVLAGPIIKLLADPDQRIRIVAMYMTNALKRDDFTKIRPALRKLLDSESQELRLQSAIALAAHQDPAAGAVLLAYLKQPEWDAAPLLTNRSIEATATLTGARLGFISAPGRRDTPQNSQAIQKLEQWVNSHPVTND